MKLITLLAAFSLITLTLTGCLSGGGAKSDGNQHKPDPNPQLSSVSDLSRGQWHIANHYDGDSIRVSACDYDAGAVCSIVWKGKQFIDDKDHGRQLQCASTFDGRAEVFNPTEAGGSHIHYGHNPSDGGSKLLSIRANGNLLETFSQMAYWNPVNNQPLSNHTLNKRVTIGYEGLNNVIHYQSQFNIPANERHGIGLFEAPTAYLPAEFNTFWSVDVHNKRANPLMPAIPPAFSEQDKPVIISTADQQHALGIYAPELPQKDFPTIGYGAFFFANSVPKWNAVFRVKNPAGSLHFRAFVVVGTKDQVANTIGVLHDKFH